MAAPLDDIQKKLAKNNAINSEPPLVGLFNLPDFSCYFAKKYLDDQFRVRLLEHIQKKLAKNTVTNFEPLLVELFDMQDFSWYFAKNYLNDQDRGRLSQSCRFFKGFFQEELTNKAADRLLSHVVRGEQNEAELMIAANPSLLLIRTKTEDYSGRTIIATPFQAALGAEDEHMWQMMMPYFEVLESRGTIDGAQQTMRDQFDTQFPDGIDVALADELLPIYHNLAQGIIQGNDEQAIVNFRELIAQPDITCHGKHFNMQHLIAAHMAYIDNFDGLATRANRNMFWCRVIGYVQRQMPANYAQAYCSGLETVLNNRSEFKRTSSFENGEGFFPLTVNSGLGFDFAGFICSYGVWSQTFLWGADWYLSSKVSLLESHVKQKQQSLQDLSRNLNQVSVINQCTIS